MSEPAAAMPPSAAGATDDLASALRAVPLFDGMADDDLRDFAQAFTSVELGAGEVLWWQATPVDGLHILLSGDARVSRRLPGEREVEIARLGPGAVMGEIPLLGGGAHSATVRAASPCSLAFLRREDFHARVQLGRASALTLKRRIVEIACERIRSDHRWLAAALGDPSPVDGAGGDGAVPREPMPAVARPPHAYASRLPFFRRLGADVTSSLLEGGETLHVAPRRVLVEEGDTASHCYITLNGAVEDVLRRGTRSIRVRFAGPGRASGYLGLIDGGPASTTSLTRERTTVLAIDAGDFRARLQGDDDLSRAFTAAVEHDLMDALRSTASPKAHLAAAGAG